MTRRHGISGDSVVAGRGALFRATADSVAAVPGAPTRDTPTACNTPTSRYAPATRDRDGVTSELSTFGAAAIRRPNRAGILRCVHVGVREQRMRRILGVVVPLHAAVRGDENRSRAGAAPALPLRTILEKKARAELQYMLKDW